MKLLHTYYAVGTHVISFFDEGVFKHNHNTVIKSLWGKTKKNNWSSERAAGFLLLNETENGYAIS